MQNDTEAFQAKNLFVPINRAPNVISQMLFSWQNQY